MQHVPWLLAVQQHWQALLWLKIRSFSLKTLQKNHIPTEKINITGAVKSH
ncbi:hypothetical protein HMPREF9080_02133 [Cardiobacterium valvarum F0432]|uniref:Uncharacterized protein n=1 Tax=Cardiobacterium valvarum F0432 TaxID=797473 RepID=G9ZH76_9GAMM|nr:hypothetical protein HMPREF9080_02133 [Cardiobacterium valvarum F0432]